MSSREPIVCRCRSSRDASVIYTVRLDSHGDLTCTCPGYAYRRRCKHTIGLTAINAIPIVDAAPQPEPAPVDTWPEERRCD